MFERLTELHGGIWGMSVQATKQGYDRYSVFSRLAAYENSELSPEEVQELAKAQADGRLVVLPCKVGDTVWCICPNGRCVAQYRVNEISFNGERLTIQTGNNLDGYDYFAEWYFSREAAEKALGGGEE